MLLLLLLLLLLQLLLLLLLLLLLPLMLPLLPPLLLPLVLLLVLLLVLPLLLTLASRSQVVHPKVTSALASDADRWAQTVSLKDPLWLEKVAEPAKHLATDTMDELSHGWGRGLAMAYALFWIFALAMFSVTLYLSAGMPWQLKIFFVLIVSTSMYIPIAMSMDPASVSTSCDDLLTELNIQRCELLDDEERSAMIRRLEEVSTADMRASCCCSLTPLPSQYLNTLNTRQGLGFSPNGAVLDKNRLRNMMVAVGGIFDDRARPAGTCTAQATTLRRRTAKWATARGSWPTRAFRAPPRVRSILPVSLDGRGFDPQRGRTQDQAFIGARKCKEEEDNDPYTSVWQYEDGSKFDYTTTGTFDPKDGIKEARIKIQWNGDKIRWTDAKGSNNYGVVCSADLLSNLERSAAVPYIQRLGGPQNCAILNAFTLPSICKAN